MHFLTMTCWNDPSLSIRATYFQPGLPDFLGRSPAGLRANSHEFATLIVLSWYMCMSCVMKCMLNAQHLFQTTFREMSNEILHKTLSCLQNFPYMGNYEWLNELFYSTCLTGSFSPLFIALFISCWVQSTSALSMKALKTMSLSFMCWGLRGPLWILSSHLDEHDRNFIVRIIKQINFGSKWVPPKSLKTRNAELGGWGMHIS